MFGVLNIQLDVSDWDDYDFDERIFIRSNPWFGRALRRRIRREIKDVFDTSVFGILQNHTNNLNQQYLLLNQKLTDNTNNSINSINRATENRLLALTESNKDLSEIRSQCINAIRTKYENLERDLKANHEFKVKNLESEIKTLKTITYSSLILAGIGLAFKYNNSTY